MIVYRLASAAYKDDLTGTGAKLYGGRWNSPGFPVVYTAENISLTVLEILVRVDKYSIPVTYSLVKISFPDTATIIEIHEKKLKRNWEYDLGYTQWMGDEFLKANEALIMKVPSAVVPEENNYLLNPGHPDFKKIKITETDAYHFDKRLFITNE